MIYDDEWAKGHLGEAADAAFVAVAMCAEVAEQFEQDGKHEVLRNRL